MAALVCGEQKGLRSNKIFIPSSPFPWNYRRELNNLNIAESSGKKRRFGANSSLKMNGMVQFYFSMNTGN